MDTFDRTRRILAEELGVGPAPELRQAHLALLRSDQDVVTAAEPFDGQPDAPATVLPTPADTASVGSDPVRPDAVSNDAGTTDSGEGSTASVPWWIGRHPDPQAIVGRTAAVAQLVALVAGQRVVTLVGPGGAGKTALALATARAMVQPTLPEPVTVGVIVVECGRLPSERVAGDRADLIVEAVRATINVRPTGEGSVLELVIRQLRGRRPLLILDNAEHVRVSCMQVVDDLARACPSLRILVTSRRQLGLPSETVWEVEPLALPPTGETSPEALLDSPAVQLFVDLARRARRTLDLSAQLETVALICRQLEGLPLAIELAATRLRAMSLQDLADRLSIGAAEVGGSQDHRLPHQQALQATFEWSAQLLSPAERCLLGRLSIFPTAFDLAAAEEICSHSGLERAEIALLIANLVDQSMIQIIDDDQRTRYRLLNPIREFAENSCRETELSVTRRRHLRCCQKRLDRILLADATDESDLLIADFIANIENLYVAVEWALESGGAGAVTDAAELLARSRLVFDRDFGNLHTVVDYTHTGTLAYSDVLPAATHGRLRHWAPVLTTPAASHCRRNGTWKSHSAFSTPMTKPTGARWPTSTPASRRVPPRLLTLRRS